VNALRGVAVGLALVSLAACRTPTPDASDRLARSGVPLAVEDQRVQRSLARVRAVTAERTSLRAAARVVIDAPELSLSRPQRLVVERPDHLRIEVLALFDQVAGVVATDGVEYGYVDLTSGVRDTGPVDEGLLWRTARIDLAPADAVALLLGGPRLGPDTRVVEAFEGPEGEVTFDTAAGPDGFMRRYTVDPAGRIVGAGLRVAGGEAVWSAIYGDWREVSGQPVAHRLDLVFPRVDATVRVVFHAVELNPALAPGLFVLHVAPGG
jgi:hypothetical protein